MENEKPAHNFYNIHYSKGDGTIKKVCLAAESKDHAHRLADKRTKSEAMDVFEWDVRAIYKLRSNPPSDKMLVARPYRTFMGAIAILEHNLRSVRLPAIIGLERATKHRQNLALCDKQLAKLKRDVQDMYRNLGLKIK